MLDMTPEPTEWPVSPMDREELRRRRHVLFVMLTVLAYRYPGREPALPRALRQWLGGWAGLGRITLGMSRQGFDLQLTRYGGEGWRATFYPAGRTHSATRAAGSAWTAEPWHAVQQAAWDTLRRTETA
jgi:hypothetical protein